MTKQKYANQKQELVEKIEEGLKNAKKDHIDWEELFRLSALIPLQEPKPYIYPCEPTWKLKKKYKDSYRTWD